MRLHYLQHVPFEGLGNIEPWARGLGWEVTATRLYRSEKPPSTDEFDWLIVMGGPMNIYEEKEYPWLSAEKKFIARAIESNKIVVGVCLGAQLIAEVTGGRVFRNRYKEIGWFPVRILPSAPSSSPFKGFPDEFMAFHWHGDTFSIGRDSIMLAESEACSAQAFSCNNGRVLGLQFHLETSPENARTLIQNCGGELVDGQYIQGPQAILGRQDHFGEINRNMVLMLDNMRNEFN